MSEYDVYLNGVGYHLLKRPDGQLQTGACQERRVNPFTQQLSPNEQYIKVPFRFGDGGGLAEHDGSARYRSADFCDTRAGRMAPGAFYHGDLAAASLRRRPDTLYPGTDFKLDTDGGIEGTAERFQCPAGKTAIRAVQVMVRRDRNADYTGATTFTVAIASDTGSPPYKPNVTLGSATVSIKAENDAFLPWPDRWRNGKFFFLDVVFSSDITVTPNDWYWIVVWNSQAPDLYVAQGGGSIWHRSNYNGTSWSDGADGQRLYWQIGFADEIDTTIRCMCPFRGSDGFRRLYMGQGYKVMACDMKDSGNTSYNSKLFDAPVVQLLEFSSKLFAAQGPDNDMWYTNGASGTGTWTQVTGQQANALAVHDNMLWKADGASLIGCTTGTTWTGTAGTIGDPGTPIQSMVSHGGKLFCAKPEGIFEVTYPSDYPSGTVAPVGNMMLDFSTELSPRTWMLDWHSGLYFPGLGGVYELKGGILRNLWTEKVDEGAQELDVYTQRYSQAEKRYTKPRRWGPLFDAEPGAFVACTATTRGLYLVHCGPNNAVTHIWHYDGRNWHDLGPIVCLDSYDATRRTLLAYCLAIYLCDMGGGQGNLYFPDGLNFGFWRWPTWTDDRLDDSWSDYVYDDVVNLYAVLETPIFSGADKSEEMALAKVGITGAQGQTGNTCTVYYKKDDDADWQSLGDGTPATGGYKELSFPAGTGARCVEFQLRLLIATGNTIPIVIDQLDLMYQEVPEGYTTHQLMIHAAPDLPLHDGGVDTRTTNQILDTLRALVESVSFTYLDPAGGSHTVRVTGLSVQHIRQTKEPGATLPTEAAAILTLLDV